MVVPIQPPLPEYLSGIGNLTSGFSPVTLNYEWPTLYRLLGIVLFSIVGTMINGFFVASFFVEGTLKTLGNIFLAGVGLADLLLTTVVMPTSAVVLLSGEWDSLIVCRVQQFLVEAASYCFNTLYALIAVEGYCKMCCSYEEHDRLLTAASIVTLIVFVIGFVVAGVGVFSGLDYDYCQRLHHGNSYFKLVTALVFHLIPGLITYFFLIVTIVCMHARARRDGHYRRSLQYESDRSTMCLKLTTYTLFVAGWTPYLIVLYKFPNISPEYYYQTAWIGVLRSVFVAFLYAIVNTNFRSAFGYLFNYCCCKSSLTGNYHHRHRRAHGFSTSGEVRVHIMHQVATSHSPQRGANAICETRDL